MARKRPLNIELHLTEEQIDALSASMMRIINDLDVVMRTTRMHRDVTEEQMERAAWYDLANALVAAHRKAFE